MALLDDLVGGVIRAVGGDQAATLTNFLSSQGGVSGLAQTFQRGGAGEVFASWVSNGENQPITADLINTVLGTAQVQQIAQKLGVEPAQASQFIAQHLPTLIDQLTPDGRQPSAAAAGQG